MYPSNRYHHNIASFITVICCLNRNQTISKKGGMTKAHLLFSNKRYSNQNTDFTTTLFQVVFNHLYRVIISVETRYFFLRPYIFLNNHLLLIAYGKKQFHKASIPMHKSIYVSYYTQYPSHIIGLLYHNPRFYGIGGDIIIYMQTIRLSKSVHSIF